MAESKNKQGFSDNSIYCTEVITDSNIHHSPGEIHSHELIELIYAINAETNIWIDGCPYRFSDGDLAIVSPGISHTKTFFEKGHYYSIKFSPKIFFFPEQSTSEYKYFKAIVAPEHNKGLYKAEELNVSIKSSLEEIMREWASKQPGYELILRACIIKIFATLFRYSAQYGDKSQSISSNGAINNALAYISANYATVTEQQAADYCGLSLAYFSTLFKNTVGIKFGEYVMRTKIDQAKHLLLSSNKSITYIAYETGFSSSSHFISRFKEYENTTPAHFRRQIQSSNISSKRRVPQITVYFKDRLRPSGPLLIFKYRTNRKGSWSCMAIFPDSQRGYPAHDDLTWATVKLDENWHVVIVDLSRARQLTKTFLPREDGKYYATSVAIHPFYGERRPTEYVDFSYIAFAETIEDAMELIGDGEDVSYGFFSYAQVDDKGWGTVPSYSKKGDMSVQKIPAHHFMDERGLYESVISSDQTIRKIELLNEFGIKFIRIWST